MRVVAPFDPGIGDRGANRVGEFLPKFVNGFAGVLLE